MLSAEVISQAIDPWLDTNLDVEELCAPGFDYPLAEYDMWQVISRRLSEGALGADLDPNVRLLSILVELTTEADGVSDLLVAAQRHRAQAWLDSLSNDDLRELKGVGPEAIACRRLHEMRES